MATVVLPEPVRERIAQIDATMRSIWDGTRTIPIGHPALKAGMRQYGRLIDERYRIMRRWLPA